MKKTVKWIKENVKDVVQCQHCGSLNYYDNIYCIDKNCLEMGPFLDTSWDREQEVEILNETHTDDTVLYI